MVLRVLGSSSAGNCYLLQGKNSTLIIECGIPFKQLQVAMQFDFSKVCGALVTHEHGDHAKAVKNCVAAGIDVYSSPGTFAALNLDHHRVRPVNPMRPFMVGEFKVLAFDTKHDVRQPYGFLINHPECGNVLFLTDTEYVEYKFKDLNHIIVEANYCESIITQRFFDGKIAGFLKSRTESSHMSLQTCKRLLQANDLSKVRNIVLIHLSDSNSDAAMFHREIQGLTGKTTHIATGGLSVNLDLSPF